MEKREGKNDNRFPRTALGVYPFPKWRYFFEECMKKRKLKFQMRFLAGCKKIKIKINK